MKRYENWVHEELEGKNKVSSFNRFYDNWWTIWWGLLIGIFLLSAVSATSRAADITLAWDANTETDLAGYKLYYGKTTGQYNGVGIFNGSSPIIIPLEQLDEKPVIKLSGLTVGTYFFAVTAYNVSNIESNYSNELSEVFSKPSDPIGLMRVRVRVGADGVVIVETF